MVVECFMRLGIGFILISECGKEFGYWLKLQCFDHKNIGKVKWLEYMKLSNKYATTRESDMCNYEEVLNGNNNSIETIPMFGNSIRFCYKN